ncbi:acylase [Archangium lansingense]|uniref:Acylase n=1 Tax=Archangium lansingense TaxID=2995310 RepID=A0ABT3ZX85_9BACT|nr:acylase [Archangium lansinium]MCY1073916.1 acylase [Archangium lansinium]
MTPLESLHSRRFLGTTLLALALSATGCGETDDPSTNGARYEATVRRTAFGVPHITADDLGSAGYGQGYAFAQDNACTLLDQIIKVRGERARYLGAGPNGVNVATDFAYRALELTRRAQESWPREKEDVRELISGYVAGFNHFLSLPLAQRLPCAGEEWVKPITEVDLAAYHRSLGLLLSGDRLIGAIAAAQPPGAPPSIQPKSLPLVREVNTTTMGSNGWALGANRTNLGRGMLVSNPHFPWEGEFRLWESHLTVPGKLNVYGVGILGVPGVLIGFNENVAWTHTVSASSRFTAYMLPLVPGKPTSYVYDGQVRDMTALPITVQVLQADGTLADVSRTYYSSHYGPILALPGIGWNTQFTITYRDANIDNESLIAQFLGMSQANSMEEFQQVFANVGGIPWVHTMATDKQGNAWYADAAATPNLSQETLQAWGQALANPDSPQAQLLRSSIVLLDGSTSRDEWVVETGSRSPGLIPFTRAPKLLRRDFVFNANDSHWLANPAEPLTGFSPLQGQEGTPRSLRTRMNAKILSETGAGTASGADSRFTLNELQDAILSNRSSTAEMLLADVVTRCASLTTGTASGQTVDVKPACNVLAAWNGRYDTDSVGAILWRQLLSAYGSGALYNAGTLLATPFSPAQPLTTPSTLKPAPESGTDPLADKLAAAVLKLKEAGLDVSTPLGQAQYALRGTERIPVHGGIDVDGVTNICTYDNSINSSLEPSTPRGASLDNETRLSVDGYVVNTGTSFLMALEYTENGPRARAFLTYGQSADPESNLYRNQLQRFSQKQWRPIVFAEKEIANDPALGTTRLSGE